MWLIICFVHFLWLIISDFFEEAMISMRLLLVSLLYDWTVSTEGTRLNLLPFLQLSGIEVRYLLSYCLMSLSRSQ